MSRMRLIEAVGRGIAVRAQRRRQRAEERLELQRQLQLERREVLNRGQAIKREMLLQRRLGAKAIQ